MRFIDFNTQTYIINVSEPCKAFNAAQRCTPLKGRAGQFKVTLFFGSVSNAEQEIGVYHDYIMPDSRYVRNVVVSGKAAFSQDFG